MGRGGRRPLARFELKFTFQNSLDSRRAWNMLRRSAALGTRTIAPSFSQEFTSGSTVGAMVSQI